jgi:hypothetical protein
MVLVRSQLSTLGCSLPVCVEVLTLYRSYLWSFTSAGSSMQLGVFKFGFFDGVSRQIGLADRPIPVRSDYRPLDVRVVSEWNTDLLMLGWCPSGPHLAQIFVVC